MRLKFKSWYTAYLIGDLDEESENDDDKQVVEHTDSSNDTVDDSECK